jgi:Tol biopolymer transport system component
MSPTISIFIVVCGLVFLVVAFFYSNARRFRLILSLGGLLLLAVGIATSFSRPVNPVPSGTEPSASPQPTRYSTEAAPISPLLPVSPIGSPGPTIVEADVSEINSPGCLAFTSNRTGDFEIFVQRGATAALEQFTDSPGFDLDPAGSSDGARIAFASNREENAGFQIYVMNADGSNQARLAEIQPGDNSHPSWSADGEQLVFQSKRDTNANLQDDNFDIYKMNSDGSNISILVADPADDTEPTWSPDGRRIAFLSERSGRDEVYLVDADGANLDQLSDLLVLKSGLSWSGDGRSLIFEGDGDIYRVDIETKQVNKLIAIKDANEATPAWAGDDKFVVFSSDRAQNWELYAVDVSNPDQFPLYQLTHDPGIDRSPAWFPCSQE